MKKISALVGAAVLAMTLSSCGDHLDGTVTSKGVDPGYTTIIMQQSQSCNGSTCTTTSYPITYFIPECRWIKVNGSTEESSGKTCLDDSEWDKIGKGDKYVGEDVSPKDRKQKR